MSGQDFTVTVVAGVTNERWLDPPLPANPEPGQPGYDPTLPSGPGHPSRLNYHLDSPHRRYVGSVGTLVQFECTVGGAAGPPDSALGGRLFQCWFVETPAGYPGPTPRGAAGQSSQPAFTPSMPGHFALAVAHGSTVPGGHGGTVIMHVDVEP